MIKDRLYINEKEVDLSPDTVIALTFQINDLAELKDRQANFSNQFKLPKSRKNRMILGNPDLVQSPTVKPYRKLPARLFKDGIEVVQSGYAIIESSDQFYNVTIYSGNVDFFDLIEGKYLSDLDLSDWDHVFNFTSIVANRATVTPYKYPIIDYGSLSNGNRNVDSRNLRPSYFLEKIVDKIFEQAPFNKSGAIFSDSDYKKISIAFAKNNFSFVSNRCHLGDTANGGDPPNLYCEIQQDDRWEFTAVLNVHIYSFTNSLNQIVFDISDYFNHLFDGTDFPDAYFVFGAGTPVATGDYTVTLKVIGATYADIPSDPRITIAMITDYTGGSGVIDVKVTAGSYWQGINTATGEAFKVDIIEKRMDAGISEFAYLGAYDPYVLANITLPEMLQSDVIKTVVQKYGIIFKTDPITKTLIFKRFEEIIDAIPQAKDWTGKLHWQKQNHKIEVRVNYGQTNYLRYKEDSNDKDIPENYGDGSFDIDDETLASEKDLFTLPFAATKMEKSLEDLDIPLIRKIEDGEFKLTTEPRLLVVEQIGSISGDPIHFFDAGHTTDTNDQLQMAYFKLPSKTFNIDFKSLIEDNYQGVIATLQKFKKLTLLFNLTASDIAELDHFIPIYLSQFAAYFYINKVINWKGIGLTQVELIRIQSASEEEIEFAGFTENYELEEDIGISLEEGGAPSLREDN